MITEWRLGNFKSVADNIAVPLAPLTVLAGANSSGKSTLVHSILLIAQTLQNKMAGQPLVLNGDYVKLGTSKDVAHAGCKERPLEIGFTIEPTPVSPRDIRTRRRIFSNRYVLFAREYEGQVEIDSKFAPASKGGRTGEWKLLSTNVEVETEENKETQEKATAKVTASSVERDKKLKGVEDAQSLREPFKEALLYDLDLNRHAKDTWRRYRHGRPFGSTVGAILQHFLPHSVAEKYSPSRCKLQGDLDTVNGLLTGHLKRHVISAEASKQTVAIASKLFEQEFEEPDEFWREVHLLARQEDISEEKLQKLRDLIDDALESANKTEPQDYQIEGCRLPDTLQYGTSAAISEFSENLRYLGPLRDDPKPIYSVSPLADPTDIGLKGEYVATVLQNFKAQEIDFVHPKEDVKQSASLSEAVCIWLRHMGMLEDVSTSIKGKLGLELSVKQENMDKELDLTNVGVGVSQVLPILVMGLLADEGQILIFEQPEIHLHPKVQSLLGDFFLSLMRCGKQCIIETHSEYLIKRLRLRVAQDVDGRVIDNLLAYFVEKREGVSHYGKVDIADNGKIRDWPKDFFDEGARASQQLLQASLLVDRAKDDSKED